MATSRQGRPTLSILSILNSLKLHSQAEITERRPNQKKAASSSATLNINGFTSGATVDGQSRSNEIAAQVVAIDVFAVLLVLPFLTL